MASLFSRVSKVTKGLQSRVSLPVYPWSFTLYHDKYERPVLSSRSLHTCNRLIRQDPVASYVLKNQSDKSCECLKPALHFLVMQQHRGMAGHSKWANIKHIKGAKDAQKQAAANKIAQKLKVAVREGGGTNPKMNFHLARVLAMAKSHNVPTTTVDSVLKALEKSKDSGSQIFVEAKGPGGCFLIVEAFTDKAKHTRQMIQSVLKKSDGTTGSTGFASHSFEFKGLVQVPLGEDIVPNMDEATDAAIEVGAEDVENTYDEDGNPVLQFVCDPKDLHAVKTSLQKVGKEPSDARLGYLPHIFTSLNGNNLEMFENLIDKLEMEEDVIRVYNNVKAENT